jgi:hypothetical protein
MAEARSDIEKMDDIVLLSYQRSQLGHFANMEVLRVTLWTIQNVIPDNVPLRKS